MSDDPVLPAGLPAPVPLPDGLDAPYWEGTRAHQLRAQRCQACGTWQWGPEWICHACHAADVAWETIADPVGVVYSWERVWHPVHPALRNACPYVVLLVELPGAGGIRMVGNRVGDAHAPVVIGSRVTPVFEDHDGDPAYTLVQWRALSA